MTEHDEQVAVMEWAALMSTTYPGLELLFAIPNGTRTTYGIARKMRMEGVKKGVPDLFLPVPKGKYHGLFVEMKTQVGHASPEQKDWLKALALQGYCAVICKGADEAIATFTRYMEQE